MEKKIFKESFVKPMIKKALKEENENDLKDIVTKASIEWSEDSARADAYWKNEVLFQIDAVEDLSTDERIVKASEEEIEALAERVAERILNDDRVWEEVNSAIEWYIYHDDFMLGAENKSESCEKRPLKEAEPEIKRTGHTEGNKLPDLK